MLLVSKKSNRTIVSNLRLLSNLYLFSSLFAIGREPENKRLNSGNRTTIVSRLNRQSIYNVNNLTKMKRVGTIRSYHTNFNYNNENIRQENMEDYKKRSEYDSRVYSKIHKHDPNKKVKINLNKILSDKRSINLRTNYN